MPWLRGAKGGDNSAHHRSAPARDGPGQDRVGQRLDWSHWTFCRGPGDRFAAEKAEPLAQLAGSIDGGFVCQEEMPRAELAPSPALRQQSSLLLPPRSRKGNGGMDQVWESHKLLE